MEYNILKYMRQRHLPTPRFSTVQFYLTIVLIITLLSRDVLGSTLGSKCQHDMDCTDFIKGSSCSAQGYCECAPYYVQYNTTTCLSSQLLGGDCTLNEQCTMKVANSSCLDGACRCVEGFLQFRKHTCLGPAPPGSVCYSHAHCQMFNERTHCDFLIPNLFGRCQCTLPAKLKAGLCIDNTATEATSSVTAITSTTTSTTLAPVEKTEATVSSTQEQYTVSTEKSNPAIAMVESAVPVDSQKDTDENSNVSIEEQIWEDDKNIALSTLRTPSEIQGESLTPAAVDEQQHQHETTESVDSVDISNTTDDYPYKIEEEDDQNNSHNQEQIGEHVEETTVPQEKEEEEEEGHSEEYGHVIDNTMNFDYEAAHEEMEEHLDQEDNNEEVQKVEQEQVPESYDKYEQEQEKQPLDSNHDHMVEYSEIHNLEQDQHLQRPAYESEQVLEAETEQEHQLQHESRPEESAELHNTEHEKEIREEYVTVQESDKNKNDKENSETQQIHDQQNQEHEQEEDKIYEIVHEEPVTDPENKVEEPEEPELFNQLEYEPEQIHQTEEVYVENGDTVFVQNPDQPSYVEQEDVESYTSAQEQEQQSEEVYEEEEEQDKSHESTEGQPPEQILDSQEEQEHAESNETVQEKQPEKVHESQEDQENVESHEAPQEQQPELVEESYETEQEKHPEQVHESQEEQKHVESHETPQKQQPEQVNEQEVEQSETHEKIQEQQPEQVSQPVKNQDHINNYESVQEHQPEEVHEPQEKDEHVGDNATVQEQLPEQIRESVQESEIHKTEAQLDNINKLKPEQNEAESHELDNLSEKDQVPESAQNQEISYDQGPSQVKQQSADLEKEYIKKKESVKENISQQENEQELIEPQPGNTNIQVNEHKSELHDENLQQPAQEHEEINKHNKHEEQTITQQVEHNDDNDHAVQQHVDEQDIIAQLDHIIPDNKEIYNIAPEEQDEDGQEESLNESTNLQSIANEIHHHLPDEVAVENESVQNENEATTQQLPEAVVLTDDEVVTTQSPVLEEEDKNNTEAEDNNNDIDFNNSQEHQEFIDASAVDETTTIKDEKIEDNDEEEFISKKTEADNAADQTEPIHTEEEQKIVFQEPVEKIFEAENHIYGETENSEHQVLENFQHQHEDKPAGADQINKDIHNVEAPPEEQPISSDEEKLQEQFSTEASAEEAINTLHKEKEEEELPYETMAINLGKYPVEQEDLEQNNENDQSPIQQENESVFEDPKPLENNFNFEFEKVKETQNEIYHEETDGYREQQNQENFIPNKYLSPEVSENKEKYEEIVENEHVEHQEGPADNNEDNLIESTTLTTQDEQEKLASESLENHDSNQSNASDIDNESESQGNNEHLNINNEPIIQKEENTVISKEEEKEESEENKLDSHVSDATSLNADSGDSNEEVQQSTEALETNYVPFYNNENKEDPNILTSSKIDDNAVVEGEQQEIQNKVETEHDKSTSIQDSTEQTDRQENTPDGEPDNAFLTHNQTPDLVRPENEEFKESESISDILYNLMKEDVTLQPEYSEEPSFNSHLQSMHESDVPDLLAEDTNISEETVLSQQQPTNDSTEASIDPEDKLITFYPDMQELQLVQQWPITSKQEREESAHEASGEDEKSHPQDNQIIDIEHEGHHTLSPLDLPFDTSVDYEPQQFEADNLVVETTTISATELKPEEGEQAETTTKAGGIDELTTQTMLNLASRVTLMEPAAPISTTLKPLVPLNANDEVTAVPAIDAPIIESLLTTKPTTEIRKRVELSLEAVSLGLSCSNNKQCQLADPYTICNARGVCDCAARAYSAQEQTHTQCSAERTGCAPGTFQCRSSGVCISWFFVCDGRSDCNDASDEECTFNARLNQTCPSQAFQCAQSGRCISRAALCDGRKQCPHGEDEIGCSALKAEDSCPPHTFRCKSGECLPEYEYCNAIITCRDGSDEPPHLCGSRSMPNFFLQLLTAGGLMNKSADNGAYCPHRCTNGRCRSTAIVCSGRDGCGDGTDEQTCSVCRCPAANMDRQAINVSEFLARHRPMHFW